MTEHVSGRDRLLADLIEVWQQQLVLADADADTDFIDCDGSSMTAVRITTTINQLVGWRVSPDVIFEHSTPRAFAAYLVSERI